MIIIISLILYLFQNFTHYLHICYGIIIILAERFDTINAFKHSNKTNVIIDR